MTKGKMTPAALRAAAEGNLENFLAAATPGGIERQEAQGQRDLAASFTRLPTNGMQREILERLGFQIGAPFDDLFTTITAPTGWHLRPTEHSMHSEIVDDKGRVRGGMFYKAAFYDRSASMFLRRRYNVEMEFPPGGNRRLVAKDNADETILAFAPWREDWQHDDEDTKAMSDFLAERFPDWENIEAYW